MCILEGRIAIVTGASSGVERGCAIRFAEEGAKLVIAAYEDFSQILAFMDSEAASYLNGQFIGIDGGLTLIS